MMENLLNVLLEAKRIRRGKAVSPRKNRLPGGMEIDWTSLGLAVWQTAA